MTTSPAPNAAAPPGMCPGVVVLGGGGGSGGGDGNGSGNGDGSGGNSDGNGDGTGGDGKDSGACGEGGAGGCANCGHNVAGGDPVDVSTGRVFTVPKEDLFLPGLFNLSLVRSYGSERREVDVGLGFGWTHSLAWTLEERNHSLIVRTGDGRRMELPRPKSAGGEVRLGPWGVFRGEEVYAVRPGDEFIHFFRPVEPGSKRHLLDSIVYRKRGRISLHYERGQLASAVDTVGRVVLFNGEKAGRIESIAVPEPGGRTLVFARYAYDDEGNLIAAADADGHTTRYAYDDEHRLTRLEYPNGIVFHFVYRRDGRCVETWGAYPDQRDPALADGLPNVLRDGHTRARGIYHCHFEYGKDYTELTDSVRYQRFFIGPQGTIAKAVDARGGVTTRTFDAFGRVTSQMDPENGVRSYQYDPLDQIVQETDPEGNQVTLRRDEAGRPIEIVDAAGGMVTLARNASGEIEHIRDQNGALTRFVLDAHALVVEIVDPRGGRRLYEHDAHANMIAYTTATGGRYRFTYDYWGHRLSESDPLGNTCSYRYSNTGRITAIVDGLGRTTTRAYDAMGNLLRETYPDGTSQSAEYGGLNWLCRLVRADGTEVRVLRNREGWPVLVQNELGQKYELKYGLSGLLVAERDFLGREIRYGHDALGRVVWVDEGDGKRRITVNKNGQVVGEEAPDGSVRAYTYNRRGELVEATSDGVMFSWLRDATGKILREELRVDGATYEIESKRNAAGDRDAVLTSLGHELRMRRDAAGAVTELWTPSEQVLAITRNLLGMSARRDFARGGALVQSYDAEHRLESQKLLGPGNLRRSSGEPEWVGPGGPVGLERWFDYTPVDEVRKVASSDGTEIEYTYDVRRRVVREDASGVRRDYRVDAIANYNEADPAGPRRSYDEGGRLLAYGEVQYRYDEKGRLIEKRRTPKGAARAEVTRFVWNAWSLLQAVVQPDGTRVEFEYDAFARRFAKRTVKEGKVVERHHYVWDLLSMVHDVAVDESGQPAGTRTYLFEDNRDVAPVGHRQGGDWIHYVADINSAPLDLVDSKGRRVETLTRTLFGRTRAAGGAAATTPFRFLGQIEDPETGLHYNRYRYYDPDTGRYISPDPTLLAGGLNLYAYGPNPVAWVDPMGWETTHFTIVEGFPASDAKHGTETLFGEVKYNSMYSQQCPVELKSKKGHMGHSEQKFCYDLLASRKKGGEYKLTGSLPPCQNCHGAMMRAAQDSGSKITYDWGNGNSITYDGKTDPGRVDLHFGEGSQSQYLKTSPYANYTLNAGTYAQQDGQIHKNPANYWGFNAPKYSEDAYTTSKTK